MDTKGNPALFERLAVARLQYTVNELQTKVDYDRRISPPVKKTFHCVTDDSALVQSIGDLKRWTAEGIVSMTVPLCTLDALDDCKKGTDPTNVNSRESIRYFDRCQSSASAAPRKVRVQSPSEQFSKWDDCAKFLDPSVPVPAMAPPSPPRYENWNGNGNGNGYHRRGSRAAGGSAGSSAPVVAPPKWIQPILNCALHKLHPPGKEARVASEAEETLLVTNNDAVAAWARVYGVKAVDSNELADMIERENWEFTEKKRVYDNTMAGGRGNGNGNGRRGGRGGGGRGHRRDSSREEGSMGFSPPRGNHTVPDQSFILRGAPRGVARGRGKLWEP